jgi:CDP-diacylglycerol--glycerol-3-phosphate 3-phosphatidyltransferase
LLSLLRLVLSPFLFLAIKANNLPSIITLTAIALLSDFFDGQLARRFDSISDAGKILDPLADKVCVAMAALALTLYGDFPLSLLIIIVARDLAITIFGLLIMSKRRFIPVSNRPGKVTVFILAVILLVYVFKLEAFYSYAFALALIFIGFSSILYLFQTYKYFSNTSLNNSSS